MSKVSLMMVLLALSVRAGTIVGLVVPGVNPNYTVQLPLDQSNNTGISLDNLLIQNPQNIFAFTSQTNSGPRNLIGYFDPVLPALQVIWTTPYLAWVLPDEPNFERFIPPPPTGCGVTGTCPPPPPPVCLHDCHQPPGGCGVTGTCPPPPTQVPESNDGFMILAGLGGIAALRPRAH
jgi:hypothetical protein